MVGNNDFYHLLFLLSVIFKHYNIPISLTRNTHWDNRNSIYTIRQEVSIMRIEQCVFQNALNYTAAFALLPF